MEIKDKNYVPTVSEVNGKINLVVSDRVLNEIFKNNTIISFGLAFPGTNRELLLRTYIIECNSRLIDIIKEDYSHIYLFEKVPEVFPLFIPNDLGISGFNGQPELLFVGADLAWDISTGSGTSIGISEIVNINQEDLVGKSEMAIGVSGSATSMGHGTQVALIAGANTNNGIGMASMGFDSYVLSGSSYQSFIPIAQNGGRVINMSWGSCNTNPVIYENELINELWEDYNVVLVAAAGNGSWSCSSGPQYDHFPASFNNVISVTNVGHEFEIGTNGVDEDLWQDVFLRTNPPYFATYNTNVDLSAPGRNILTGTTGNPNTYSYGGGTSYSAPMVTGTIGLMFGINSCLFPDEVESILKLTAVKNDTLLQNLTYNGLIGAGRLDAFRAVDMARDMAEPLGTVEVKERVIDRWDFVLKTNPYAIRMSDNTVTHSATLDFTAQDNIEILSGDYAPDSGFIDLSINPNNSNCNVPLMSMARIASSNNDKKVVKSIKSKLFPNPNNGSFTVSLENRDLRNVSAVVYDVVGKPVYHANNLSDSFEINLPSLASGIYFVKLSATNYTETLKFIKK